MDVTRRRAGIKLGLGFGNISTQTTVARGDGRCKIDVTDRLANIVPVHLEQETRARITVIEIAQRLNIGRMAVYAMLEQGVMPGIRIGRRWIITWNAYSRWERTCGMRSGTGLETKPEVRVLN